MADPAMHEDEEREREAEQAEAHEEEPALQDEEIESDTPAPHSHHALHDMHDYYTAGMDTFHRHMQLADNPELKDMLADHSAQLEAMSGEVRDLHEKLHPERDHPVPYEDGIQEESEMPDDEEMPEEEETPEEAIEEETPEEEREGRRSRKSLGDSGISQKALRALERKVARLEELLEAEDADLASV